MQIKTTSGQKFTVEVLADQGHALKVKVLEGPKVFKGKILLIAKNTIV